jgi:hypothetical protein
VHRCGVDRRGNVHELQIEIARRQHQPAHVAHERDIRVVDGHGQLDLIVEGRHVLPELCVGAASGADQDEQRATTATNGPTIKNRRRFEQLLCLGRCPLNRAGRFLAGGSSLRRNRAELTCVLSRPGAAAIDGREPPAVDGGDRGPAASGATTDVVGHLEK